MKTEHVTNMVCEHVGLRRKCGVCEITAERDLLRRQVDVMANDMARTAPPENYPSYYDDWMELLWAERVQWWVKWSLAKAKEGRRG